MVLRGNELFTIAIRYFFVFFVAKETIRTTKDTKMDGDGSVRRLPDHLRYGMVLACVFRELTPKPFALSEK